MSFRGVALVLALLAIGSECHDWGMGGCPHVSSQPKFNMDKFLGMWYVIEQFDTASSCYVYNYTKVSATQLKVTKGRQFDLLDSAGIEHTNSYTGALDIPSGEDPGRMRVKWPANILGKGDYIVFATDYDGYAGVYDCQQMSAYMHRKSAAILSRKPSLDKETIVMLKDQLKKSGVDDDEFDSVEHKNCVVPTPTTLKIDIDDSTLKNIFKTAVNGVADLGHKIADGTKELVEKSKKTLGYGVAEEIREDQPQPPTKRKVEHIVEMDPDAEMFF